jgi:hypothetical protein
VTPFTSKRLIATSDVPARMKWICRCHRATERRLHIQPRSRRSVTWPFFQNEFRVDRRMRRQRDVVGPLVQPVESDKREPAVIGLQPRLPMVAPGVPFADRLRDCCEQKDESDCAVHHRLA